MYQDIGNTSHLMTLVTRLRAGEVGAVHLSGAANILRAWCGKSELRVPTVGIA
jgi:hypothetical protein